ncbi:hypothetical protein Pint_18459 [Pistacia integerrima]|uniref:Uncharacterized protein n=1 Tax=Pistacia integerrima TaxID=434235 RepID=A0ACC0Z0E5_9ROSI|nr:hypothetical protein Pint_18459 [Pistacia integerrima]
MMELDGGEVGEGEDLLGQSAETAGGLRVEGEGDMGFRKLEGGNDKWPRRQCHRSVFETEFVREEKQENLLTFSPPDVGRDVSYNNQSNSLPLWIQEQNLQLNLVANNFNLESSNYSR